VPVLGRIPIIGNLFRSRKTDKVKTNLLVFIRAKILRDSSQTSFETNSKYNQIRDVLENSQSSGIALMPKVERPTLPPLEGEEQPSQDDE
jgi:general secretion pathway protein D